MTKHKDHERVHSLLLKEQMKIISTKERIAEFQKIRREGILLHNKKMLAKTPKNGIEQAIECEKRSDGVKVMCSLCKGFFSQVYFYKHRRNCCHASSASSSSHDNKPVALASVVPKGIVKKTHDAE